MNISCAVSGSPGACQDQAPVIKAQDAHGRRIYVHEDSFKALAQQGYEEAQLVYSMAARTVALKAVRHLDQDVELMGINVSDGANVLQQTINLAWSENTTRSLKRIAYRSSEPRLRVHLYPLLVSDEAIAASCYFSNYYTYATGAKTAQWMFEDTNEIASVRQLMKKTDQYSDLTLINGQCLFLIDSTFDTGVEKAKHYVQKMYKKEQLQEEDLKQIKTEVYFQTKESLEQMFEVSFNKEDSSPGYIKDNVMQALDYAFAKGILKAG